MKMKKLLLILSFSFSLALTTSCTQNNAESQNNTVSQNNTKTDSVDWTPLFQSWENQCADNLELLALIKSIPSPSKYNPNDFSIQQLEIPAQYQSAVLSKPFTKKIIDNEQSGEWNGNFEATLPVSGYYYDMPLVSINFRAVEESEIYGMYIMVDMPIDKVKNILSKKANIRRGQPDDGLGPNPYEHDFKIDKDDDNPNYTHIGCWMI